MSLDYIEYEDYHSDNQTDNTTVDEIIWTLPGSKSSFTNILVAVNIVVSIIGLGGNALVIWICGWKMKRTVVTTWYMSLAVSDFLFCALLPFEVFYMITSHWPFGQVLCKLSSSGLFLNMYSSVFLLVVISIDRCVMVWFPVWAHNHRTVPKAFGLVALIWFFSSLLTLPSLIFRQTINHDSVIRCYTEYTGLSRHKAVALSRFVCGFLIPCLITVVCCVLLGVKLRSLTIRSKKPYKIMGALILSFFCCWVPYHTFVLLELDFGNHNLEVLRVGLKVGTTLASANNFLSPILYVFIGNDFKQTLKQSLTSKIEDAMAEDLRTGGLSHSRSKSMDIIKNSVEL